MFRPDDTGAPGFWMYETSGVLQPAVKKYLEGGTLDAEEIEYMRAYLYQWVAAPGWDGGEALEILRLRVAAIKTQDDLDKAIEKAVALGLDPL